MSYVSSDAAAYERSMGRWSTGLAEVFLDACALPPGARVLDAGCGTGALSAALIARDPRLRIEGVDLGESFVAAARRRVPRARFDRGDVTALAAGDGSFDAALSLLVLQFVPDRAAAARELRRVTRPGGSVAVAMWDFWGGFPFLRLFADTAAAMLPEAEAWRASQLADAVGGPGRLGALLEGAGLVGVSERDLVIRQEVTGFDDWWRPWLGGQGTIGAFIAGLAAERREAVETAARRAFLAGAPDGPRSFVAVARMATGQVPG